MEKPSPPPTTGHSGDRMGDAQPEYPPVWLRVPEMSASLPAAKNPGTHAARDVEQPRRGVQRKIHGWAVVTGAALGVAVYWVVPSGQPPAPTPDRHAPPRWNPSEVQWRLPEQASEPSGLATQGATIDGARPGSAAAPESKDQVRYGPAEDGPALRRGIPPAYARPPDNSTSPSAEASQPRPDTSPGPVATLGKIGPARPTARRDHRTIY